MGLMDENIHDYVARKARADAGREVHELMKKLDAANQRIEELEEAYDYAQKVYENFLRDWFPGEEGKTWEPGFTSRKFVEMIGDRFKDDGMKRALVMIRDHVMSLEEAVNVATKALGESRLNAHDAVREFMGGCKAHHLAECRTCGKG